MGPKRFPECLARDREEEHPAGIPVVMPGTDFGIIGFI